MSNELADIIVRWLSARGPREWHGVASAWNFHRDITPILWILDQPQCDRATALDTFWRLEGYYQIDPAHPLYTSGSDANQAVAKVLENWPRYSTSRFHFRLPDYVKYIRQENFKLSAYALKRLEPLMIEIDGTERYPMYDEMPAECRIEYLEKAGKPVADVYREQLARERMNPVMAPTTEELKQRNLKQMESGIQETIDMLTWIADFDAKLQKKKS